MILRLSASRLAASSRVVIRPILTFNRRRFRVAGTARAFAVKMSLDTQDTETTAKQAAFAEHQKNALKLSAAERAKTIFALARTGTLSTLTSKGEEQGYPRGSVVEYAADTSGRPVFSFSALSGHTGDVRADGRCSFTVTSPGFQDMSGARLTITGTMSPVSEDETPSLKEAYRQRHPNSFWIDFGDFAVFRLDPLIIRYNFGFASAGKVAAEEFLSTPADPVAPFSSPISKHMNEDHASSTLAIVKHFVPLDIDISAAKLQTLDRLGMEVECSSTEGPFTCRVPFTRPADDRKAVREVIVEMTKAAQAA